MRQRVTVIVEEICDHDNPKVEKYVFPSVEEFTVTTWNNFAYAVDSLDFDFKGRAWANKNGHYVTLERNHQ